MPDVPDADDRMAAAGTAATQPTVVTGGRSVAPDGSRLDPGARIGRFEIRERVGAGGMGEVYAAHDPALNRVVAVKLVRAGARGHDGEHLMARLQREAQAAARLSHRNVVTIYEVGIAPVAGRGELFVAMELVDGGTLDAWTCAGGRSWREVVAIYVQAGRGLAAAHAAGIVHRDFKPGNVLVTRTGEARVTDFGLASSSREPPGEPGAGERAVVEPGLTQPGAVMGTPMFMAPEQRRGEPVDARADQFAFAVALYRAIHGVHPFGDPARGAEADELASRPDSRGAPSALREILRRALRHDPAERYPAMDELLAALERLLSRRPGRALAIALGGAALIAAGAVAVTGRGSADAASCDGAGDEIAAVWGPPQRDDVAQAFAATSVPFAADAAARVTGQLDAWAARWAVARVAACRSIPADRARSTRAHDLRVACLERQRMHLAKAVAFLTTIEADAVPRASQLALNLPPADACSELAALEAAEPARDPVLAGRLDDAQVRFEVGRYVEGTAIAQEVLDAARARSLRGVAAEAGVVLGRLQFMAGDRKRARDTLFQAALDAQASGQHALEVRAWGAALRAMSQRSVPLDEGARWFALGREALARAGDDTLAEAELLGAQGSFLAAHGESAAIPALEEALALMRRRGDDEHPLTLSLLSDLGERLGVAAPERRDEALALSREALAARERLLGAHHPVVGFSLHNLALAHVAHGELDEAERLLRRALALKVEALGPHHPSVSNTLIELASLVAIMERFDEAIAFTAQDVALWEAREGSAAFDIAFGLAELATLQALAGRPADAHASLERGLAAVAADESTPGRQTAHELHARRAWVLVREGRLADARATLAPRLADAAVATDAASINLVLEGARLALRRGRPQEAHRALVELERRLGDAIGRIEAMIVAELHLLMAETHAALGDAAAARGRAERALATCGQARCRYYTADRRARAAAILR